MQNNQIEIDATRYVKGLLATSKSHRNSSISEIEKARFEALNKGLTPSVHLTPNEVKVIIHNELIEILSELIIREKLY